MPSRRNKSTTTSIRIFRDFIKTLPDGSLDATQIISTNCFKAWLKGRKSPSNCPEKAFQRALSGHITGVDGRVPFDEDEEEAILKVVRRKERWECFKHCDVKFGEMGFRTNGFHEKARSGKIFETQPKKRAKGAIAKIPKLTKTGEEIDIDDDDANSLQSSVILSTPSSNKIIVGQYDEENDNDDEIEQISRLIENSGDEDDLSSAAATNSPPAVGTTVSSSSTTTTTSVLPPDYIPFASRVPPLSIPDPSQILDPHSTLAALQTDCRPLSDQVVNGLLAMLTSAVKKFESKGLPWWGGIHGIARMILISRGFLIAPTLEDAHTLMDQVCERYPSEYVLMFDLTAPDYLDRIILQNDIALNLFGGIDRKHGGFRGRRFPPEETWKILKSFIEAYANPAKEIPATYTFYVENTVKKCQVTYFLDPNSRLLVERGHIVD